MWRREVVAVVRGCLSLGIGFLLLGGSLATTAFGAEKDEGGQEPASLGAELFMKEWTPGEPSTHGGDGLGPVYNDTSCVACHNLGGVGGAGPKNKNVQLISASVTPVEAETPGDRRAKLRATRRELAASTAKLTGKELPRSRSQGEPVDRNPLIALHAGFRESSSVMVHRYGPERDYESWRIQTLDPERGGLLIMTTRFGGEGRTLQQTATALTFSIPFEYGHFTLSRAQLNPAALFGVGLIDAIPDAAIEASTEGPFVSFPGIKGRVSRLPDGRLGRFGWKAQAATLDRFVLTACAVELGLDVPGHAQAENPRSPAYRVPGIDLTRAECQALTQFVRGLPAPIERTPSAPTEAAIVTKGRAAFERIGCAACHVPKLGPVEGIYSDLLLHEMGNPLSDTGSYSPVAPSREENDGTLPGLMPDGPLAFRNAVPPVKGPSRGEWRTPPLWGVRDSGPYLHDGRAETLEQAIAFHDGEAAAITAAYFKLATGERQAVLRFLKSLTAPSPVISRDFGREAPDFIKPLGTVGLR